MTTPENIVTDEKSKLDFSRAALSGAGGGAIDLDPMNGSRRVDGGMIDLGGSALAGTAIVRGQPGRAVRIDMPVSLGRAYYRPQDGVTMLLGLRCWQAIHGAGLNLPLLLGAVVLLPVAVRLVSHHAQRRQATISDNFSAHLARLFAAQQQANSASAKRAAASARQQPTERRTCRLAEGLAVIGTALTGGTALEHV